MRKLGQMLADALGREDVIRAARARNALKHWPEIVGPSLAARSHPEKVERGTVWVAVSGSEWAQELRMRKDTILTRLRAQAGSDAVFADIRFGVRPVKATLDQAVIEVQEPNPDFETMTIREIAERRLANWDGPEGSSQVP